MKKKAATKKPSSKKKATRKGLVKETYVALVVDRSGSMGSIYEAALSGVNEQINTLKLNGDLGGKTFVSVVQFDSEIDVLFENKLSKDLEHFTHGDFQPRGTTAMYDGVGRAIESLKAVKTTAGDIGYLVIVISDGMENASRDYTSVKLAAEIEKLQNTGKWTFTYMLANVDLSQVSNTLGVPMSNMSTFVPDSMGVHTAYASMGDSSTSYLSSRAMGISSVSDFYIQNNVTGSISPGVVVNSSSTRTT